jgi:hypothetical protein
MGLDANIYSRSPKIPKNQQKYYDQIEIAYFRKFHDLHQFFYEHHNRTTPISQNEYNGVETEIDYDVLEKLKLIVDDHEYEWAPDLVCAGVLALKLAIQPIQDHLDAGMYVTYNSWW